MVSTTHTASGQKLLVNGYPGMEVDLGMPRKFSDEEFLDFCRRNPEMRIERNSSGGIEIMAPTSTETGELNQEISGLLWLWAKNDGTGKAFDSSTGFTLSNDSIRSPDASWIRLSRWDSLSTEDRSGFALICPDFVMELRSETDPIGKLRAKMAEYIENGASLGWLIDPVEKRVYVYRPDAQTEILEDPSELSGESVLNGFVLKLSETWN